MVIKICEQNSCSLCYGDTAYSTEESMFFLASCRSRKRVCVYCFECV